MAADLKKIIQSLEQWSSGKVVILSGHGGEFCTGSDLNFVGNILDAKGAQVVSSAFDDMLTRFSNLPLISVAVIP